MSKTLFQKIWDSHAVRKLPDGQTQLFIDLHLIHEVTSPQAFAMLRERGLPVAFPGRTFATVDHIIPTDGSKRPLADDLAEEMMVHLENNCRDFGISFFGPESGRQGVIHVIGPELGLTQPGMTIACGDSHTATHGAFGAIAFGIGTSQVRDLLATQSMAISPLKVRRIDVDGGLGPFVSAKDVILHLIRRLGVKGGLGFAYEYGGMVIDRMNMEERMTLCNMSIEGGARCGYVNPDDKTFAYLKGRPYAPKGDAWAAAVDCWRAVASDRGAKYDDVVHFPAEDIPPMVTWGVHPGQAVGIDENLPAPESAPADDRAAIKDALAYMKLKGGAPIKGVEVGVVFIGSCTNGRIGDFRAAAKFLKGRKVAKGVRALAVPGSMEVRRQAASEGIDRVFIDAGFDWRQAGCSMCLAMNPDKLVGDQLCAATSNRNFKGRQGSPAGRTVLMSPVMAAAAAVAGCIADAREVFG
jgi:3-isopropylmalate/(R)-2-methylmalate dehydratase large subunit